MARYNPFPELLDTLSCPTAVVLSLVQSSLNTAPESHPVCFCCRLREVNTLKGKMESVVRQKGLDMETIQQSYTV